MKLSGISIHKTHGAQKVNGTSSAPPGTTNIYGLTCRACVRITIVQELGGASTHRRDAPRQQPKSVPPDPRGTDSKKNNSRLAKRTLRACTRGKIASAQHPLRTKRRSNQASDKQATRSNKTMQCTRSKKQRATRPPGPAPSDSSHPAPGQPLIPQKRARSKIESSPHMRSRQNGSAPAVEKHPRQTQKTLSSVLLPGEKLGQVRAKTISITGYPQVGASGRNQLIVTVIFPALKRCCKRQSLYPEQIATMKRDPCQMKLQQVAGSDLIECRKNGGTFRSSAGPCGNQTASRRASGDRGVHSTANLCHVS